MEKLINITSKCILKKGDRLKNDLGLWTVTGSRKVKAGIKYNIKNDLGYSAKFLLTDENIKASQLKKVI